ncbi:MAG: energy coupling factor transporter S component ThiW [Desulfurococcales archaeon]|nr:energy coupling factor transporter S component ThiW [Desulfurococcales archaeon]
MVLASEWGFLRKLALMIVMMGLAISLSPLYIPIGPTKAFPWQHMVNVILGVILGPLWATAAAALIGGIRMMLGVGTIFSIPGGIPGAVLVGLGALLLKRAGKRPDYAAFLEPLGTAVIGFLLALYIFAPLVGVYEEWLARGLAAIWLVWAASTAVGTIIGFTALNVLRRTGLI